MLVRRGFNGVCVNGLDPDGNACFEVTATGCVPPVASVGDSMPCVRKSWPYVGLERSGCCDTSSWFTLAVAGVLGFVVVRGLTR